MKQIINFRLQPNTISLLTELSKKYDTTRTNIIEMSVNNYAKRLKVNKNKLSCFAGALEPKAADTLLKVIRENRRNKKLRIKL
jgi:peptidyl-tRNA hydrolase